MDQAGDANSQPAPGLPPVAPPSGRFIAQLFLVPGLIVLGAVLLLLLFRFVAGGAYAPDHFLKQLDSDNADIRWRAASDLAQVLEKPDNIALRCDTAFALGLTKRLQGAWEELVQEEKNRGPDVEKLSATERDLAWRKLSPLRDYVRFLMAAVARSNAPVALPLLADIALRDQSPDVKGLTLVRRQALWALGILGQNVRDFKNLPPERQGEIFADLEKEAGAGHPRRSPWARNALHYLDPSKKSAAGLVAMDQVLAKCAQADDPYIREHVALALMFYDGPLVRPTLHRLARDDGHGTLIRVTEDD